MARFLFPPNADAPRPKDWSEALADNGRWLRTVVLARLGDGVGVDEVMQEVALAVVRQKTGPGDVNSPAAWLYRIALRKVLLYRRSHGRRNRLLDRYAASRSEASEADPLDWLLLDERKAFVREALRRLPPRDAEILLLKYTEDWTYRDLAGHLGISESAVEARLHRARGKLRDALAGSSVIEVSP